MCYSGKCRFENYMGDCILYESDRLFLAEKYKINHPCPEYISDNIEEQTEHENWLDTLYDEVLEHRESIAIMRKLSNWGGG